MSILLLSSKMLIEQQDDKDRWGLLYDFCLAHGMQ